MIAGKGTRHGGSAAHRIRGFVPRDCACEGLAWAWACLCVLGLLLLVERDELRLRRCLLLGRQRRQRGRRLLKLLLPYREL